MKRAWISLTVLLMAFCTMAKAEVPEGKKVTGGVGINATALRFANNLDFVGSKFGFGAEVNGFLNIPVSKHFAFQFGLTWGFNQAHITNAMTGTRNHSVLKTMDVEVPMYFMLCLPTRQNGNFFIGAGPYTDFVVKAKMIDDGGTESNPYELEVGSDPVTGTPTFALNKNNSGLGAMVGYETPFGLRISGGFSMSISDILGFKYEGHYVRQQKITLGVAYHFGRAKAK